MVRSFDAAALEKHEVVAGRARCAGARELVGSGGNLLDQNIVIADPETLRAVRPTTASARSGSPAPAWPQGYWRRDEETQRNVPAPG